MRPAIVRAPVSLLLDPGLTPAARLLWLAIRMNPEPLRPTSLAARTGLTPATVRKLLAQLSTTSQGHLPSEPDVAIPSALLPDSRVRPQAKLLYGLLQTLPTFKEQSGQFRYTALSACTHVSVVTARESVRDLTDTGWLQVSQANQKAPIHFTLRDPVRERGAAEAERIVDRLQEANFRGEAIMREYLSLLIDSDEFEDNARPGFLINPLTKEPMELDRYYFTLAVAFEYNGPQHDRTTKRFPSEKALAMQMARDMMKESICARRGIQLLIIKREHLMLRTMQQVIGGRLPLRDLSGHDELIKTLEQVSKAHRA